MGNFGQNPDDPSGHLVVENGNFNFFLPILAPKKNCWKNVFFCGLCPWAYQLILFCQNIFVSAHVFLEIFFLKASGQFRFYSLSKELCSLEYWLLEKPPGNSSAAFSGASAQELEGCEPWATGWKQNAMNLKPQIQKLLLPAGRKVEIGRSGIIKEHFTTTWLFYATL